MRAVLAWIAASRWGQGLVLLAVCVAVFLPRLGATGLSMSEGHRVIPAWEMLDDARDGDPHWLEPRMFGTTYLRKPPGVMWAIAASGAILGQTEFAARLPSALAAAGLAMLVWHFATRWFGAPWGLAAGLAQALLPVTWPSARSAEIESLHMLATGAAALLVIDLVVRPSRRMPLLRGGLLGIAACAMILIKGPSGGPVVLGAVLGGAIGGGVLATRAAHRAAAAVAMVAIGALGGVLITRVATPSGPVVSQSVGDFLWERERLLEIILISPTILLTMLPVALVLLFPWGPDARQEREAGGAAETSARVLGLSAVLALATFEVMGVSNARYGLPLCALVTPLVAYVTRGAWSGSGMFVGSRPRIARAMLLRSRVAWPAILLVGAGVYIGVLEPSRRSTSGRAAGVALAAHLPDGAVVWADEMIEARPEVLHYAKERAASEGRSVQIRWIKPAFMPEQRPDGLLLLLREDDLVNEVATYREQASFGALRELHRGEVHKYTYVLCTATIAE